MKLNRPQNQKWANVCFVMMDVKGRILAAGCLRNRHIRIVPDNVSRNLQAALSFGDMRSK